MLVMRVGQRALRLELPVGEHGRLAQAEAVIHVQGKVHALLEEISKSTASDE